MTPKTYAKSQAKVKEILMKRCSHTVYCQQREYKKTFIDEGPCFT